MLPILLCVGIRRRSPARPDKYTEISRNPSCPVCRTGSAHEGAKRSIRDTVGAVLGTSVLGSGFEARDEAWSDGPPEAENTGFECAEQGGGRLGVCKKIVTRRGKNVLRISGEIPFLSLSLFRSSVDILARPRWRDFKGARGGDGVQGKQACGCAASCGANHEYCR